MKQRHFNLQDVTLKFLFRCRHIQIQQRNLLTVALNKNDFSA